MRDPLLSLLTRSMFPILRYVVRGRNTVASDQQINYPPVSNDCKYTFSIWTFPVERYPEALRAYFDFCKRYRDEHGFRLTLPSVGYRTFHDRSALLSYTYDGDSLTIDPVSNPLPGWDEFLHAYNEFAKRFDGTPLLNQSKHIDRASAAGAFGERLDERVDVARSTRQVASCHRSSPRSWVDQPVDDGPLRHRHRRIGVRRRRHGLPARGRWAIGVRAGARATLVGT